MRALLAKLFSKKPLEYKEFLEVWEKLPLEKLIITYGQKESLASYQHLQVSLETDSEQQLGFSYTRGKLIELIKQNRLENKIPFQLEKAKLLQELTHKECQKVREHLIECIQQLPQSSDSTTQLSSEDRSLKVLKLSAELLRNSLAQCKQKPEAVVQSIFYFDYLKNNLHLKVFNLEFLFLVSQDQVWLELYDYKKSETDRELKVRQNFRFLAAPAFDEILKVIIDLNQIILR